MSNKKNLIQKVLLYWAPLLFCHSSMAMTSIAVKNNRLNFSQISLIDYTSSGNLPRDLILPSDNEYYPKAYSFSYNNQLFALFQQYEPRLASIRVWNTKEGKIEYRAVINNFDDASNLPNLTFSTNSNMIIIAGIVGSPLITWKLNSTSQAEKSCYGYMGGEVLDIEPSNNSYTTLTVDGNFSLCYPDDTYERLSYKNDDAESWWGNTLRLPYEGKVLTIYNSQQYLKPTEHLNQPSTKVLAITNLWDLNYTTNAKNTIKLVDQLNQQLYLVDSVDGKTTVSQWNYRTRTKINQQIFDNVEADQAYLSIPYLLLQKSDKLTLIELNGNRKIVWQKNLGKDFDEFIQKSSNYLTIKFSPDQSKILIYHSKISSLDKEYSTPLYIIHIKSGEVEFHEPTKIVQGNFKIDSEGEYFLVTSNLNCSDNTKSEIDKTLLYRISDYEKVSEINGKVLDTSPDGNTLFVCNGNKYYLLSNKVNQ